MKTIQVKDVKNYLGEEIKLQGWVRNYRKSSSKLRFIIFRDGSGDIQSVCSKPEMGEEKFEKTKQVSIESSVIITGIPGKHPKKDNVYELQVTDIAIIGDSPDYPISKKEHGTDFLMKNRHLWIRSRKQWATLRIRHTVYYAITDFLNSNDFIRFDSPILTPSACEGTTTLFEVPYFDLGSAFLSQSGQLYLETGAMSLGKVYDFGPVFRAEKSKTRKHLTEFWMMDAEMAYVNHEGNMKIQEEMIRFVIRTVLEKCSKELEILERDVEQLKKADSEFKCMTHHEVVDYLRAKGSEITYNDDLSSADEALLTEGSDVPIFIEKWPKDIKAFYMKRDENDDNIVLGSDLIAPEGFGEIIGGSERETDYDIMLERMNKENMDIEEYQWYLDLRKYGSVVHSGFGVGLERLTSWMAGSKHVRECIPYARMIYRIHP